MLIGYARVSTEEQNLDLQIDALVKAGVEPTHIYREKISSRRKKRPELEHALKALRLGDTLVVWRLDRIGRSVIDLAQIAQDLNYQGIELRSLTEQLDTHTAGGRLIFNVFSAVAQFERDIISERTKAGLAAARKRGTFRPGKKKALKPKEARAMFVMYDSHEFTVAEICQKFGIKKSAFYRYREHREDYALPMAA